MNLHEYQSKKLFADYGLPVTKGYVCENVEQALSAIEKLSGSQWIAKCQIHAGGRGKAGGVKVVKSAQEVRSFLLSFRTAFSYRSNK